MKALFAIRPKYKLAMILLTLIVILLCGVLAERSFFSQVNAASASIYKDRLVPSSAVYHLSDHISQRRFMLEDHVRTSQGGVRELQQKLARHQGQMDSIIVAFEETYLVKNESKSLALLKTHLEDYDRAEAILLAGSTPADLSAAREIYQQIRRELMKLSNIQTRVGQDLFEETQDISSNAGMISQIQVVALIVSCLLIQAIILASKAISSPLKQRHNLN